MSRQSRELKKQQERAKKYGCDGRCYWSIMNLLEIWADGSIQGYLSAKQTLRIIERVKARESPR